MRRAFPFNSWHTLFHTNQKIRDWVCPGAAPDTNTPKHFGPLKGGGVQGAAALGYWIDQHTYLKMIPLSH